jgi:rhamnose transport system substrate-binding protein
MMKRFLCVTLLFSCATLIALGCGDSSSSGRSAGDSPGQIRIGMMPKLIGISFFDAAERGAQEAAQELQVKLIYDGPTSDSAEEQAGLVNTWAAQGFDVIAVAPNDPDAIASKLADAKATGATVLTWDTDANPEKSGRELFINHTPNQGMADTLVDMMVAGAGEGEGGQLKGKFIIVSGTQTAANQNAWMALMIPILEQQHPECELLPTLYPSEDQSKALEQTAAALDAHKELKGIWAITSVALPAAAKAVRDVGRQDEVCVTGLSLPSLMDEYIKDDTIEQFALFDVEDLGYLTVFVAHQLTQGPIAVGTHDFGRVKGVTVTEDGQVILGNPVVFNKDNIDDYRF